MKICGLKPNAMHLYHWQDWIEVLYVYKNGRYKLRRIMKAAKKQSGQRLEIDFGNYNRRCMWKGLHAIRDYRTSAAVLTDNNPPHSQMSWTVPTPQTRGLWRCLQALDPVYRQMWVKPSNRLSLNKPAALMASCHACTAHLSRVSADIFSSSLPWYAVPLCFKKIHCSYCALTSTSPQPWSHSSSSVDDATSPYAQYSEESKASMSGFCSATAQLLTALKWCRSWETSESLNF